MKYSMGEVDQLRKIRDSDNQIWKNPKQQTLYTRELSREELKA